MQFPFSKPRSKTPPPAVATATADPHPLAALHHHFTVLQSHFSVAASHALPALTAAAAAAAAAANHALPALQSRMSAAASRTSLPLARLSPLAPAAGGAGGSQSERMSTDSIAERLAGVPVYALANADEEFVLVSGAGMSRKKGSLGLLCFKREDAEALLDQVKEVDSGMREGSKVVELALNKVFHLKVDGVAFRFIPDPSQVANAIKEKERAGDSTEDFSGVPVFQSKSLVLRSMDKKYHPVFFRKEDLEESLRRAARMQRKLNPVLKGDIQVGVLEEIIEAMKGSSVSEWDDVVFIPPGVDVPAGVVGERPAGNA